MTFIVIALSVLSSKKKNEAKETKHNFNGTSSISLTRENLFIKWISNKESNALSFINYSHFDGNCNGLVFVHETFRLNVLKWYSIQFEL